MLNEEVFPSLMGVGCAGVVKDACEVKQCMSVNQVAFVNGCVVVDDVFQASSRVVDVLVDLLVLVGGEVCGRDFV